MPVFILSRLLSAVLVLLGVSCLVFLLIHLVPGDPVEVMLGEAAQPADREALRHALGLDQPLLTQLLHYFQGLLHLDLGTSLQSHRPIAELLWERLPATAELAAAALLVAVVIAFPLGILAAVHKDTPWDYGAMSVSLLGVSIPNFWLGPMLMLVFAVELGWLPLAGKEGPLSFVLPAITLGTAMAAILTRMVRASVLEVARAPFVTAAYAKGLSRTRVLLRHVLANALIPVITVVGLQFGALLAGAVITETIFAWPGLGRLTVEAIQTRDYPVVQGCVLVICIGYLLASLLADLCYAVVDPRVRLR